MTERLSRVRRPDAAEAAAGEAEAAADTSILPGASFRPGR